MLGMKNHFDISDSIEKREVDIAGVACICRSVTYILWSSDFASDLEDYLMEKCCTWDNRSVSLKD